MLRRADVLTILETLCELTHPEDALSVSQCDPTLQPILARRALAFLRELLWTTNCLDKEYLTQFMLGKTCLGLHRQLLP